MSICDGKLRHLGTEDQVDKKSQDAHEDKEGEEDAADPAAATAAEGIAEAGAAGEAAGGEADRRLLCRGALLRSGHWGRGTGGEVCMEGVNFVRHI